MGRDNSGLRQAWEDARALEQEQLAKRRTVLAKRQTAAVEVIERTLSDFGNREYSEQFPIEVHVDTDGMRDYIGAVSNRMDDVRGALQEVGDVLDVGFADLADRMIESEELLRSIDEYSSYLPEMSASVRASNGILLGIGAEVGLMAVQQAHAARRREEQLDSINETLQTGFEGVQERITDVVHAVEDGLADVSDAVQTGAHLVAVTVTEGFGVTHAILRSLGISLDRYTTLGHLQHVALLEHMSRLQTIGAEICRQESASIQATMRDLAANGRTIVAEELYRIALVDHAASNQSAAIRNLHKALKKRSTFAEAWFMLGMLAFENGGVGIARDAFSLSMRYAEVLQLPIIEEQALNALFLLERLIGNERAWRALLLKKYEKDFKMDRKELFEVLRTWLQRRPDPRGLTNAQRKVLKKELPKMIRNRVNCGLLVATQSEFALIRPHLCRVETFGSWAYLLYDLNVIALRTLNLYYTERCGICGCKISDDTRSPLRTLAHDIRALLERALADFRHGLPMHDGERYRRLFESRDEIRRLTRRVRYTSAPKVRGYLFCNRHTKEHVLEDVLYRLASLVSHET